MLRTLALICAAALGAIALGGCAGLGLRAAGDAEQLYARGRIAVGRNLDFRDWIRQECIEMVKAEVAALRREDDNDDARAILVEAMPRLLTVATVEAIIEGKRDGDLDLSAWDVTYCETLDPDPPANDSRTDDPPVTPVPP